MPKQFSGRATESSKCSHCGVFSEKGAGRSVRYDRRVRNAEAAGSNPARSTISFEPPNGRIHLNQFWLKFGIDLNGWRKEF
jgi:hypothetical protein